MSDCKECEKLREQLAAVLDHVATERDICASLVAQAKNRADISGAIADRIQTVQAAWETLRVMEQELDKLVTTWRERKTS